jgi:hypothetical protein
LAFSSVRTHTSIQQAITEEKKMSTSNATVPAVSLFAEVSKLFAKSSAPKAKTRARASAPAAAPVAAKTATVAAAVAAPAVLPGIWELYRMTDGSDSVSPQLQAILAAYH